MKHGYTLLELLVAVVIIGVLGALALPYYFNAVENTRITELRVLWGRQKNFLTGRKLSDNDIDKIMEHLQKASLKYFIGEIICQEDNPPDIPCFEAVFTRTGGTLRYQIRTVNNFRELACMPQNALGSRFCKSRARQEIKINGQDSYLIR